MVEFKQPPILYNDKGEMRKAGFELEFGDIELDTVADCIMKLYGGQQQRQNKYLQEIEDTAIGKFKLKIDTRLLTERSYEKTLERFGLESQNGTVGKLMEFFVPMVVPYEIDIPPLPFNELYKADQLRQALCEHKATGTKSSLLHAYATHINPELPSFSADTILSYLRAFLLLYPWLFQEAKIPLQRRIASFIAPFPEEYINMVLAADYTPDFNQLLTDYHQYNPDRNRPLDLYPVFAHMDDARVSAMEGIGSVKPRPTFHYRLPNSLVDDPQWSLAHEWNYWVEVEKLAADKEKLSHLSAKYLHMQASGDDFNDKWIASSRE